MVLDTTAIQRLAIQWTANAWVARASGMRVGPVVLGAANGPTTATAAVTLDPGRSRYQALELVVTAGGQLGVVILHHGSKRHQQLGDFRHGFQAPIAGQVMTAS
jgi:hypothetical protein